MPYILASDNFASIGTSGPWSRTLNNALGGTATLAFESGASPSLIGTGDDSLGRNNQVNSKMQVVVATPELQGVEMKISPNGDATSNYLIGMLANGAGTGTGAGSLTGGVLLPGATPKLQIRTISSGTPTTRVEKTVVYPTAPFKLRIEKTLDNLSWVAKMIDVASGDLLDSVSWTAASLAQVNSGAALSNRAIAGFYSASAAAVRLDDFIIYGHSIPVLTGPTGEATGSTAAQGGVNTDIGNGTMYVATAVADLDRTAIIAANTTVAVTAAGLVTPPPSTGLTANTPGWKRQYLQIADVGESAIVRSAPFNTPALLAPPAGTAATIVQGGKLIVRFTSTGGPVASATASVPVASPANGAVAQPPKAMVNVSGNIWEAEFDLSAVPGDYAAQPVLASNSDNPSVSITGTVAFSIDDATGSAAPAPEADGTKPVMQGSVSLSALTQTSYTTGCDVATDNVGVVGYQVSLDGGVNWIEKSTSRTHNATGRTPGSTDAVWWRAYDAVPNYADPITRSVTLAAVPAPVITTQPGNASVVEGSGTTLTAAATVSTGALSWQWFSRPAGNTGAGTAVSGATSANLATGNLSLAQDGIQYRARARNAIGGVTEDTFTDWATVTVQSAVLYGFDFDTAPGLVFGDLAGALTALSRQSGVGIRVYAYSTVDGALVAQSSALTTNGAGRLARWESAGIQASTDYRLLFVRQSDGEVCATRMTATA